MTGSPWSAYPREGASRRVRNGSRAQEIFRDFGRDGRVLVVRGRPSQRLVNDVGAVVRHAKVRSGTVRAVKTERGARLVCSGIDQGTVQRLRNVLGALPTAQLRSVSPIEKRSFGQLLGIAWLAWVLDRR